MKNDHLGFVIFYHFKGVIRRCFPDFIIRLKNGHYLVLETKGQDNQQNQVNREYLKEWVNAVNEHGGFGKRYCDVSFHPGDIIEKIKTVM